MGDETTTKARRGFAAMSEDVRREISSMGGRAAHAAGLAHEFTSATAREAGRKGGIASQAARKRRAQVQP